MRFLHLFCLVATFTCVSASKVSTTAPPPTTTTSAPPPTITSDKPVEPAPPPSLDDKVVVDSKPPAPPPTAAADNTNFTKPAFALLGSITNDAVSAVQIGTTSRIDLFARNRTDSRLYRATVNGTAWTRVDPDGTGRLGGAPSCVALQISQEVCHARQSSGNSLARITGPLEPGLRPAWASADTAIDDTPSCVSPVAGVMDCFAKSATSSSLMRRSLRNGAWSPWSQLLVGGPLASSPACTRFALDYLCVARSTTKTLISVVLPYSPNVAVPTTTAWTSLGGAIDGTPSIMRLAGSRVKVFVTGWADKKLRTIVRDTGGWRGWRFQGLVLTAPIAVASDSVVVTRFHAFSINAAGQVEYRIMEDALSSVDGNAIVDTGAGNWCARGSQGDVCVPRV